MKRKRKIIIIVEDLFDGQVQAMSRADHFLNPVCSITMHGMSGSVLSDIATKITNAVLSIAREEKNINHGNAN